MKASARIGKRDGRMKASPFQRGVAPAVYLWVREIPFPNDLAARQRALALALDIESAIAMGPDSERFKTRGIRRASIILTRYSIGATEELRNEKGATWIPRLMIW